MTKGRNKMQEVTPSEKKLFIETYGCQMNVADSEVVASIMEMQGYHLCDNIEDADAVFVNTCSIHICRCTRLIENIILTICTNKIYPIVLFEFV